MFVLNVISQTYDRRVSIAFPRGENGASDTTHREGCSGVLKNPPRTVREEIQASSSAVNTYKYQNDEVTKVLVATPPLSKVGSFPAI